MCLCLECYSLRYEDTDNFSCKHSHPHRYDCGGGKAELHQGSWRTNRGWLVRRWQIRRSGRPVYGPREVRVQPGEHEIALRDPRYEDYVTKVSVQPGKTTKIHYKLKKLTPPKGPFGRVRFGGDGQESLISIAAGDTGPVYVNDKFAGFIDELNNAGGGMLIPPGTYTIRAETQKYGVCNSDDHCRGQKVTRHSAGEEVRARFLPGRG